MRQIERKQSLGLVQRFSVSPLPSVAKQYKHVIFTQNEHFHRTRQLSRRSHVKFQSNRSTLIFDAAGENWAWPANDVIFTQNQHRHRTRRVSNISHVKFQTNRRTSIFQKFGAASELLGRVATSRRRSRHPSRRLYRIPDVPS